MMSNPHKLILIILTFFLALTFVRGFTLEVVSHSIEFKGDTPFIYPITITNSSDEESLFTFTAWGPFTIEVFGGGTTATIPAHTYKVVTLLVTASPTTDVGEEYGGAIRVQGPDSIEHIFLDVKLVEKIPVREEILSPPPVDGSVDPGSPSADPESPPGDPALPSTGLVALPSASDGIVDAGLVVIIIILSIALWARLRNRVVG